MMDEREYHLSIGKAWLNECKNVNDMIAVAEGDMYEAKRLYYKKEKIYLETRDDTIKSSINNKILSSLFLLIFFFVH